jgi:hypothetical protein
MIAQAQAVTDNRALIAQMGPNSPTTPYSPPPHPPTPGYPPAPSYSRPEPTFTASIAPANGQFPQVPATPATPIAVAPSPPPDLNTAILAAAQKLENFSTAAGPDGGNNACAWTINQVLQAAGIPPLGANPNYVPEVVAALRNGRGQQVPRQAAKAGDLVIAYDDQHIGIGLDDGCQTVLSNSSSRACFAWRSSIDFDGYYGGESTVYRLLS